MKRMEQALMIPDNPIPRPVPQEELVCDQSKPYAAHFACYPLDAGHGQSWSLSEIFGRPIKGSCLATNSQGDNTESLCVRVPHGRHVYTSAGAKERKNPEGDSRCFILPSTDLFEIVLPKQDVQITKPLPQPSLYASRSFTGHGQERGGVQTILTNPSPSFPIEFIYFESLPWFMKPYLHTLTARLLDHPSPNVDVIRSIYYRPALDRRRGTQLELLLSVPPASSVVLTYDFDKAILRYTEYPPDANRGFDIAPAVLRLLPMSNGSISASSPSPPAVYLRTTSLLLPLPTPDFSMPYNVIILTSTVMALAFGNIFNLLVRRFVAADEVEGYDLGRIKATIIGRLMRLSDGILRRKKKTQ
jgi:GPI-anchor transamidase subunit T